MLLLLAKGLLRPRLQTLIENLGAYTSIVKITPPTNVHSSYSSGVLLVCCFLLLALYLALFSFKV